MNTHVTLIRAIASNFLQRKITQPVIIFLISMVVALAITIWLTTKSGWIWLFVIVEVLLCLAIGAALIVARIIIRLVKPQLTIEQDRAVSAFVDKFERNMDTIGTPPIILQFKILKDLLFPRGESFIRSAARDGTTLHKDFIELDKKFRNL